VLSNDCRALFIFNLCDKGFVGAFMQYGWRIPSPCGDFQLLKEGENFCLQGEHLTDAEIESVEAFVFDVRTQAARSDLGKNDARWSILEDNWLYARNVNDPAAAEKKPGVDRVLFRFTSTLSYEKIASMLCKRTVGNEGVITAFRSEKGVISVTSESIEKIELGKTTEDDEPILAVTVPRPTLCCPDAVPGTIDQKAGWLLRAFLSLKQLRTWNEDAYVEVRGSHSGHLYRIAHRHSPIAIDQGKCAWDLTRSHLMHAHAAWLPPAEEVLCLFLALGWREPWVRNPSGNLSCLPPMYPNPFMSEKEQWLDGVDSAGLVSAFGDALRGAQVGASLLLSR
jgi:hypothetical protein